MADKNFDEKYASKLRTIVISSDMSMVNKVKEIFDELKVEVVDHAPTVKMARERMILNADKLLPYNFILITNTNSQFGEEGIYQSKDILVKIRCDKLYINTPIIVIEDEEE